MPRRTIKDVYNQMEIDLKAAIPYLPLEDQIAAGDKGHASKGAAQALLAKMYVYESSYFTYMVPTMSVWRYARSMERSF